MTTSFAANSALLSRERNDDFETMIEDFRELWATRERAQPEARRLSAATVAELRSSRVLAAPIPRALGGLGADLETTARGLRRLASGAPCTALCLAMPLGNAANTRVPDDAVAPALRTALARGRAWIAQQVLSGAILAVANSEPGAGGELANTKTRAVRAAGGEVRLTGDKSFATFGPDADYFVCSARHEDGALDAFFVARAAEGVALADDWDALGMRATASVSLSLRDAPASATFVYPGAIAGVSARHWSTLLMAAVFAGIGEGALAAAASAVPASSTWARATLADCALSLDAAIGFIDAVAREDALPCPAAYVERCRRVKTFAARTALEVATRSITMAGGRAYRPDHLVARSFLDAAAGPSLRPGLCQAMDAISTQLLASRS